VFDLRIRNGTIVDGTGSPAFVGDIGITEGQIVAVGDVDGLARREIDATDLLVTPGFVDIHTHYDGQVTWDPLVSPSTSHGVTTVVMGNCGVGFAPVRPDQHDYLINVVEGIEDIPGAALAEGIQWNWETFPEYMSYLDTCSTSIDFGAQVPHGAVRTYVMGLRGGHNEPATPEEIQEMRAIVEEGMRCGALGFTMSRTMAHKAMDGEYAPGTFAAMEEVFGISSVLGALGTGVVELAPAGLTGDDLAAPEIEMNWMRRLSKESGRPVSFSLVQHDVDPEQWRRLLKLCGDAREEGGVIVPQVHVRSPVLLCGLETKLNLFLACPTYRSLLGLDLAQRVSILRQEAVRSKILEEAQTYGDDLSISGRLLRFEKMFPLGDPPNYEPDAGSSIAAMAAKTGQSPFEVFYDTLLARDGREMLMIPLANFAYGSHEVVREMLVDPSTVIGLSDGGAHCASICDASAPTYVLTHWARDRPADRLPLELAVRMLTRDTAHLYGLEDRGRLAPGLKGDVNLIDLSGLTLRPPEFVRDLPVGAGRLVQDADGYVATISGGVVIRDNGQDTGERPGRLLRGARSAAAA
jgi:N-acyl-D-amino-acid deacylase